MQRTYRRVIGRSDLASKPNQNKTVLTFTKKANAETLRLVDITTRKRLRSIKEVKVLPVNGLEVYPFEMLYGEELVVTVSANRPVTVLVCAKSAFEERFEKEAAKFDWDEDYLLSYLPYYVAEEEVRTARTLNFYATSNETFVACVFNMTSKKARAATEAVHWSKREEGVRRA